MNEATLLVLRGPDQGTRFTIGDTPLTIGRGVRSDVRILDTEVSRQHAVLACDDGDFVLRDRGSSNGTFVNGEEVRTRRLHDGDQVQVGGTVLLFERAGESADESWLAIQSVDLVDAALNDDRSEIVGEMTHAAGTDPSSADGEHTLENLLALYRISEEIVKPALPLDQLLRRTLDLCIQSVGADRGCLMLFSPTTGKLEPQAYRARRQESSGRMPISTSIVNYVLEQGQGVRTSNAAADQRFVGGQSILKSRIREALCVPMQGRYELIGVVYVDITSPNVPLSEATTRTRLDDDHLRLLLAIGRQAALALENERYQTAVVKAERLAAVGQTIAMLSHHIKNILQGVRGGSYLIDRGLERTEMDLIRRGWDIVERNQDRIYHLVMDMLTYGKDRKPALQSSSLEKTVLDVCELAESRAAELGVTLTVECDPQLGQTTFDPEGIHRAVLNVVLNAVDAVDEETGRVAVRIGRNVAEDEIFVSVEDNGPGISADQIESIFQIFESSKGAGGTGLGLAVSRKILREHGGDIRVESELGVGSRFVLAWPRIDDERDRRTESDIPTIVNDELDQLGDVAGS